MAAAGSDRQPVSTSPGAHAGNTPGPFRHGRGGRTAAGRRYAVARRLAGLFASYARQRPQLLVDWLDGNLGGLDADLAWQPQLWRRWSRRSPPIRRTSVSRKPWPGCASRPPTCPTRLSLFGHTRLAATDIELLDALATHHDLHLWLPHPSDDLWGALDRHAWPGAATDDTSRRRPATRCCNSGPRSARTATSAARRPRTDEYLGGRDRPDTLLGWVQSDIAANAVTAEGRVLRPDDRSVQVHSCHGPARQIDVLREVLLGLLEDDPTLEPRDILVMCPDIETYAPLIVAGFGLGELRRRKPPGAPAAGAAGRPLAYSDQSAARRSHRVAGHRRHPHHRHPGVEPRPGAAGAGPLRVHRRRSRRDHRVGARIRHPVGLRRSNTASCTGWTTSSTTPGASGWTASSPASRCPTTHRPGWAPRYRSTT